MRSVRFETDRNHATDYVVGPGAWHDRLVHEALDDRPVAIVVDRLVVAHHGVAVDALRSQVRCLDVIELDGGEDCKSPQQLLCLLERFERCDLPKHGAIVAVGGGTISDVAGLAALLLRRSVGLVLLPTTLLAQVDAAVGGKNGINSATTKNLVGSFHHPSVVASDPSVLTTLDARQVVSGLAECIKVFAVADGEGLHRHRRSIDDPSVGDVEATASLVVDAQDHKLRLLADDPFELSSRRLLNYGHAFAHLLEERSNYELLHGEAVLLGMLVENEVSRALGLAGEEVDDLQELIACLLAESCPTFWLPFEQLAPDLDKIRQMRRSSMNLVCVRRPGDAVVVDDVADDVLEACWSRAGDRLPAAARWTATSP